jgi:hypothetical protein
VVADAAGDLEETANVLVVPDPAPLEIGQLDFALENVAEDLGQEALCAVEGVRGDWSLGYNNGVPDSPPYAGRGARLRFRLTRGPWRGHPEMVLGAQLSRKGSRTGKRTPARTVTGISSVNP